MVAGVFYSQSFKSEDLSLLKKAKTPLMGSDKSVSLMDCLNRTVSTSTGILNAFVPSHGLGFYPSDSSLIVNNANQLQD